MPRPITVPSLQPCRPPLWALGGHAQTILGHLLPSPVLTGPVRDVAIPLPGGDQLVAHIYGSSDGLQGVKPKMVVYLFHGLGGESQRPYMQRTALVALGLGAVAILVNHRGCGAGRGLAREPYHSGRAEDLSAVIEFGRQEFPRAYHVAIGFSLSGNALLLLAAGIRADTLPDAAISVNAPINLSRAADNLHKGLNRIYDLSFMREMRAAVDSRIAAGYDVAPVKLNWSATLRDFDAAYTAPAGGFGSREEYYEACSARRYLHEIQIPTILITAADDPFVAVEDYRASEIGLPPWVRIHIERHGGHMGYLTQARASRWLDLNASPWLHLNASRWLHLNASRWLHLNASRWLDSSLRQCLQTLESQA